MGLAAMGWWTNRGPLRSDKRTEETKLLRQCAQQWGEKVIQVWDQGFASAPWLGCALEQPARFILRWPSRRKLVDEKGHRNAWRITQGKRSQDQGEIWDARRGCWRKTGIVVVPVTHLQYDQPLWLVVSRPGKGRQPWYLLTNEPVSSMPVSSMEEAWPASGGSLLTPAVGPPEAEDDLSLLQDRASPGKSQAMVLGATAQATVPGNPGRCLPVILVKISRPPTAGPQLVEGLLRNWCHRTGKRYRQFAIPLYRLRSALSRLWLTYRPSIAFPSQNSG